MAADGFSMIFKIVGGWGPDYGEKWSSVLRMGGSGKEIRQKQKSADKQYLLMKISYIKSSMGFKRPSSSEIFDILQMKVGLQKVLVLNCYCDLKPDMLALFTAIRNQCAAETPLFGTSAEIRNSPVSIRVALRV